MNFDLTTKGGTKEAANWTENAAGLAGGLLLLRALGGPSGLLAYAAYTLGKSLLSSDDTVVKQAKADESLIEAGKRNGVKKMSVTVDHKTGFQLGSNIEGATVTASAGSNGKIHLDVEYA